MSKCILDNSLWKDLSLKLNEGMNLELFNKYISNIGNEYNIEKKNIIKEFLNYIIFINKNKYVDNEKTQNKKYEKLLTDIELLMHQTDNNKYIINYIYFSVSKFFKGS